MTKRYRKMVLGAAFLVPLLVLVVWFVSAAPNRCKLVQNLGYINLAKGTLAAPRTALRTAERWFSGAPYAGCGASSATYGLGQTYSGLGQPALAISALQEGGERADLRTFLVGRIYEDMGRPGDAWQEYRRLPRDAAAYFYKLADRAQKNGDYDQALHYFSVATTINPAYPKAYYAAAAVYWRRLGDADKAAELIRQALAVDPNPSVERDFYQGLLCYYQAQAGCAVAAWESAVTRTPGIHADYGSRYLAYEMLDRVLSERGRTYGFG